jgi:hypothetical protein
MCGRVDAAVKARLQSLARMPGDMTLEEEAARILVVRRRRRRNRRRLGRLVMSVCGSPLARVLIRYSSITPTAALLHRRSCTSHLTPVCVWVCVCVLDGWVGGWVGGWMHLQLRGLRGDTEDDQLPHDFEGTVRFRHDQR